VKLPTATTAGEDTHLGSFIGRDLAANLFRPQRNKLRITRLSSGGLRPLPKLGGRRTSVGELMGAPIHIQDAVKG
jgi:hypothetical protein